MRAAVWILDPALRISGVEPILADLSARGLRGEAREVSGSLAVVVEDAPPDLAPPAGVVRCATVDLPGGAVTRRAFLELFAGALGMTLAAAGLGAAASFATPPEARPDEVESAEVTTLAELRAQGAVRFRLGNDPCIAVLHRAGAMGEEEVLALSLVCTHLGCLVEWSAERRQFLCPCHRATFDAGGNVVEGPPPRPLARLAVTIDGDRVRVHRSPRA